MFCLQSRLWTRRRWRSTTSCNKIRIYKIFLFLFPFVVFMFLLITRFWLHACCFFLILF